MRIGIKAIVGIVLGDWGISVCLCKGKTREREREEERAGEG
jgi:hypothetical protein